MQFGNIESKLKVVDSRSTVKHGSKKRAEKKLLQKLEKEQKELANMKPEKRNEVSFHFRSKELEMLRKFYECTFGLVSNEQKVAGVPTCAHSGHFLQLFRTHFAPKSKFLFNFYKLCPMRREVPTLAHSLVNQTSRSTPLGLISSRLK